MASYSIEFSKRVRKDFRGTPKRDAEALLEAIQSLAANPHPQHSKKLKGDELFRLRVGNYRIIYSVEGDRMVIIIVKLGHRKQIYKK